MALEFGNTGDQEFGYAKILVFGESGTGKTYFAGTYDNEKTLLINVKAESGTMTLRSKGINLKTITINNYADMKAAINWLKENGSDFDLVFVDSLSQWQKNLEKEIPESGNKFAKWNTIADYTYEVVHAFFALPFHVVFSCEIKKEKDEVTGEVFYNPSLMGKSKDDIPYWFDEVYYFTRVQAKIGEPIAYKCLTAAAMKYPCKSRLGLPLVIDNPKLSDILSMTVFKKIDKAQHVQELAQAAATPNQISETNLNRLREMLATKDVDTVKFLAYYGASNLPGFPDDKVADALEKLAKCKDKPKAAPIPAPVKPAAPAQQMTMPGVKPASRVPARKVGR